MRSSHYGCGRNILLASPGTLGLLGRCRRVWLHFHFVFWLLLLLKMLQRTEVRNAHHLKELVTKLSDNKELFYKFVEKYTLQATKFYRRIYKIILPALPGKALKNYFTNSWETNRL